MVLMMSLDTSLNTLMAQVSDKDQNSGSYSNVWNPSVIPMGPVPINVGGFNWNL